MSSPRLSSRVPIGPQNALTAAVNRYRQSGELLIDLTVSNPTRVGLGTDPRTIAALSDARGVEYEPDARGMLSARQAVAKALDGRLTAEQLLLTASTSEAYGLLFKLLCDPGDEVLIPRPSYPLLDHLARLEGVAPVGYALAYAGEWQIDFDELASRLSDKTRAVVIVSPAPSNQIDAWSKLL